MKTPFTLLSFGTVALVAITLFGGPRTARAQDNLLPPSLVLPAPENLAQLISLAEDLQMMITFHWLPNDVDTNLRLGYLHGLIEVISDTEGVDGFDGRLDPPYYDSIPFTIDNLQQYQSLAGGYYATSTYLASVGQDDSAADLAYDAGFFKAVSDQILLDTFGLL